METIGLEPRAPVARSSCALRPRLRSLTAASCRLFVKMRRTCLHFYALTPVVGSSPATETETCILSFKTKKSAESRIFNLETIGLEPRAPVARSSCALRPRLRSLSAASCRLFAKTRRACLHFYALTPVVGSSPAYGN